MCVCRFLVCMIKWMQQASKVIVAVHGPSGTINHAVVCWGGMLQLSSITLYFCLALPTLLVR